MNEWMDGWMLNVEKFLFLFGVEKSVIKIILSSHHRFLFDSYESGRECRIINADLCCSFVALQCQMLVGIYVRLGILPVKRKL